MFTSSQCFIYIFAVLINKVCLQDTEEGFIGGSVILPCSSTEHPLKQDIYVHWRDPTGKIVFDVIKGEESLEKQDQQYKKRAVPFPKEYERGNFSIKLIDLQLTDAGKFSCMISHTSEEKTVLLRINETKLENGSNSNGGGKKTAPDAEMSSTVLLVCITVIGILIVVVLIFIFLKRKKFALSSYMTTEERLNIDMNEKRV
ncbi:sodium channel subunit beta-4-like [Carassius auratus]|uniref:Sodium channel subunit beta-4-like n=1 Tax=Carassius auratus TaxID=7957 RepID=A0A6P6J7Q4_CARAU|nr:sodium channel subunit beta-4-like [Carassius auratus]